MRQVTEARLVVSLAFIAASIGPARGQDSIDETWRKVAELEKNPGKLGITVKVF